MRNAIICDLDGTLALLHGRNPHDGSTCEADLVNEPVARILQRFAVDHELIFCSGREDKYREQTERWLQAKLGSRITDLKYLLFMRKSGDFREDSIIKQEILDTFIKPDYRVIFVLDDRQQVVDMWRKNKLTCLQVAPGKF